MKIYTYVEIDSCTGELLRADSFDYIGPVALCDGGASAGAAAAEGAKAATETMAAVESIDAAAGLAMMEAAPELAVAAGAGEAATGAALDAGTAGFMADEAYLASAENALANGELATGTVTKGISVPAEAALTGASEGAIQGSRLLQEIGAGANSVLQDPLKRTAVQMGAQAMREDTATKQANGFNASLASLLATALASRQGLGSSPSASSMTPGLDSTYNAGQAVAPDQRAAGLHGSSGGPSTQAFTMEKAAPSAIPLVGGSAGAGVAGTPKAPSMPSQQQGAVNLRRKMYA